MLHYEFDFMSEYIHGDRWMGIADASINLGYFGTTNLHRQTFGLENINKRACVIYCKIDFLDEIFRIIQKSKFNHILITGNGDYPITQEKYNRKPENITFWFGENVIKELPNVIPIPLGLDRQAFPDVNKQNTRVIDNQLLHEKHSVNKLYVNFNVNTNVSNRQPILNMFSNNEFTNVKSGLTYETYISDVYNHNFILSPEGNGIDCVRTWTAVYLKSIAIVQRNYINESFIKLGLPLVICDDFSKINTNYLTDLHNQLINKQFSYEAATVTYWKNRIEKCKQYL